MEALLDAPTQLTGTGLFALHVAREPGTIFLELNTGPDSSASDHLTLLQRTGTAELEYCFRICIGSSVSDVTSDDYSDLSPGVKVGQRRRRRRPTLLVLAAVGSLAVAIAAGISAHAMLVQKPTSAQRTAAAEQAVVQRWREWPAGRIFPERLSYNTGLLTTETATRVVISPQDSCASALSGGTAALAGRDHCQAGLRATYVDQLQGILYTVGVLAFPSAREAAAFTANLPARAEVLPLAMPGTASSRFGPASRQASTARHDGPFVVLTTAGYSDGEPAGAGQESRASVFAPASQLAAEIAKPLAQSTTVNCSSPEWSC